MSNNKKVLELCLSPDLGGLELYMHRCSMALAEHHSVVPVIAKGSRLEQRFAEQGNEAKVLKTGGRFSLRTAWRLARLIDEQQVDLVHFHWTRDMPVAVLAKQLSRRKPRLVQSRHMTMTRFKGDPFHRFLYRHIDHMLCVTQAVADQIHAFIPADICPATTVLYPGADEVEPLTEADRQALRGQLGSDNAFLIGLVGRINQAKGQHLLIEAMAQLAPRHAELHALIVGHAMREEYLDELKQKVAALGLQDRIRFLGFTDQPHAFMQACDLMLTTSRNETFGLVTVEAMRCGTAVIGANRGGPLEIIEDGRNGLLFESGDAGDLAEKIERLYSDRALRNRLAEAGREKAEHQFDNAKHFRQLGRLLGDL
jgi:glycosyltransferase involved in cell wall biosynthesis